MRTIRCPICGQEFNPEAAAATMPFCSERCRRIDLGRWLSEEYGVPVEPDEESLEEPPPYDEQW